MEITTTKNQDGTYTVEFEGQIVGFVAKHQTPEVKSAPWGFNAAALDANVVCTDGYKTRQDAAEAMVWILQGRNVI